MAGTLTTLLVSGLLAQAPGGFTFEGREASARTEQPDGFFIQGPLPFTDLAERGSGSASLQVEDRVSLPSAGVTASGEDEGTCAAQDAPACASARAPPAGRVSRGGPPNRRLVVTGSAGQPPPG